jgi:hypothetical protein
LLQQKGFLHSSQDCARAVLQQSKIGLTIEQRQDNHYDGSYVTLAGEIILEPKKGGLSLTFHTALLRQGSLGFDSLIHAWQLNSVLLFKDNAETLLWQNWPVVCCWL